MPRSLGHGHERRTGPGKAYILCDICGRKIRQEEAILITDRYNTLYGLLVCKSDATERENPQNRPWYVRELQVQNPKLLRSERPDQNTINPNSSMAPGAPQQVQIGMNSLTNTITLSWLGPIDGGTDPILGYVITRADPQLSYQFIIDANTGNAATYYQDTTGDPTQTYTYQIAAINIYGIGPYSDFAYFPNNQVDASVGSTTKYLLASDTNFSLVASDTNATILADNP